MILKWLILTSTRLIYSIVTSIQCFLVPSTDDLPESSHSLNVIEFTETEIFQALTSLDPNKAPGITPRVLQTCALALHHLFTLSIRHGVILSQWKIHKIIPVFNYGDPSLVKNYCPVSLLPNTSIKSTGVTGFQQNY